MSYDKFIISLYNEDKKETVIREFKIFSKNKNLNLDCIGEGFQEKIKNYDLIKINSSKIIAKIDDNLFSTWIKIDEKNKIYIPKYIKNSAEEINKDNDIKNDDEDIINNKIEIKGDNEINKEENENKNINYEDMDINELNTSICELNNNLKEKYEELRISIKNNNQNEAEIIKKIIKDIDNKKLDLFNIKQKKKLDEIKRTKTFMKESQNLYKQIPEANNDNINSDEEKKEYDKLKLNINQKNNKKYIHN